MDVHYKCTIGRWEVTILKQRSNLGKRWLKEEMGSSRTLGEQPNYTLERLITVLMWGLFTYFTATPLVEIGNAMRAYCYSIASNP